MLQREIIWPDFTNEKKIKYPIIPQTLMPHIQKIFKPKIGHKWNSLCVRHFSVLFAVTLYTLPRKVVQISSTSASISAEPCKLRYIITRHLAEACKYRQLLHQFRAASRYPLFSLFWWPAFSLRKYCHLYVSSCHSSRFSAEGVLRSLWRSASGGLRRRPAAVASGGLWRAAAASSALRRPPAPSGALWRPPAPSGALRRPPVPSGALRRPPAPCGALRCIPAPSGALRRLQAASGGLRRPAVASGLWKESCNGKACTMKRDLREGGVIAQLAVHNKNILDLNLNLPQTPEP